MEHLYLGNVLNYIRNAFIKTIENGSFAIINGRLTGTKNKYITQQYIIIKGSILNDGLYQVTPSLTVANSLDEEFDGVIYGLAIPMLVIQISKEVRIYEESNPIQKSNIISTSWGGWSESKATGANGGNITWQELFDKKLMPYKKMFTEVII